MLFSIIEAHITSTYIYEPVFLLCFAVYIVAEYLMILNCYQLVFPSLFLIVSCMILIYWAQCESFP